MSTAFEPDPARVRSKSTLTDGVELPYRAFSVLTSVPGLKRYIVIPIAANAAIYLAVFGLAIWGLVAWDILAVPAWDFWGPVGRWLASATEFALETLAWLVAIPVFLALAYFTFTTVGMVVAAPFHDALSERVEKAMKGSRGSGARGVPAFVGSATRGVGFALRTLLWQLVWIVITLPFLLVPGVGFLPMFAVVAWFSGLGFVDVPLARYDFRLRHRRAFIRRHRAAIFGLGVVMEILFLVPFLGLLLLPLGVIGGTLLFVETDWERLFYEAALDPPPGFLTTSEHGDAPSGA